MIEVTSLSSITSTESFRVDGLGNAKLLIVQCVSDPYPEIPKSDPIRDLRSQLQELQTEKSAHEQEVAILKAFGKSMAQNPDLTPDQAKTFSDTLFDKVIACAETARDIDEKIRRLNQKISKIQSIKYGGASTKAVITILADEDGPAQLRLIYRESHGTELKRTTLTPYAQVYSTLVGTHFTTYTQLQKTESHPHRFLSTTASISRNVRERIGPTPS